MGSSRGAGRPGEPTPCVRPIMTCSPTPSALLQAFGKLPGELIVERGDVRDSETFSTVLRRHAVDRLFPFAEAREALHYMESAAHFGKICIRV